MSPITVPAADSPTEPTPGTLSLRGSPLGIAWFFLYGYSGVPPAVFLPQIRDLGAGCTKVYLFWQQIEPAKGQFDWTAVDAFVDQLHGPEEGLISLFSSSRWAAKQPSAMLPPSPAVDLEDYYRFVHAVVSHCRGRVRYWQNDAEPNNPIYWSGTREEFVAQLQVFHRAVKDADPEAQVVVGGYDGLFVPPGLTRPDGQRIEPFPRQQAGLDFFDYVLKEGDASFDRFDLRLYGDPYTIEARVAYMRERMAALGHLKPVICTEYGGPAFFEFPDNRKYLPLVTTWSEALAKPDEKGNPAGSAQAAKLIAQLYDDMANLAPQTRMFMQGCGPGLEAKYQRIQARGLVMRNIFAFAAGVQKTMYWDLPAVPGPRDDLMTLMYGKIGLLALEDGVLKKRTFTAEVFARMASALAGIRKVTRIETPDQPALFAFAVDRGERKPLVVLWERRDAFSGEDAAPIEHTLHHAGGRVTATDAFGTPVDVRVGNERLTLPVSLTPIFVECAD